MPIIIAILNLLIVLMMALGIFVAISPDAAAQYYFEFVATADPERLKILQTGAGILGSLFFGGLLLVMVGIYSNTRRTAVAIEKLTTR